MTRTLRLAFWTALGGSAPLLLAFALLPGRRALVFDLYLLLVGGAVVFALARAVGAAVPLSQPEPSELYRRSTQRLPELERTERAVFLAASNAFDVHYRLRPILREIAAQRLATRRGLELDRDAEAARAVVGERAWQLVRPDRDPPDLRHGPGIAGDELGEVVAALERI